MHLINRRCTRFSRYRRGYWLECGCGASARCGAFWWWGAWGGLSFLRLNVYSNTRPSLDEGNAFCEEWIMEIEAEWLCTGTLNGVALNEWGENL